MAGLSRSDLAKRRKQMAEDAQRMDINLVAKKWKVMRTTVVNACRQHGVKVQSSRKELAARRKKMAMFAEKNGVDDAAQEFGVSIGTVYGACRENGINLVRKPQQAELMLVITRRLLDGERQSEITRDLGVSRQYVSQVKRRAIEAGFRL
jgi:transposase